MSNHSTHYVTTSDGVIIGGTVHGHGPPLVFLQGVIGDGDLDFQALVGHLADRFTCHLPSLRGRGLSGDHPDLSLGRQTDDVLTYLDSIEAPTGLVGWSLGSGLALLAAAAQPDAVTAVALLEPLALSLMDEHEQAAFGGAVARLAGLAAEGRLTDASRAWAGWPFNDEEIAVAEGVGYFEAAGRYVPNMLSFFEQQQQYRGPMPDDPAVLSAVSAPVLVVHGADARAVFAASARHVADHLGDATVHHVPGAGHATPLTHPEALAEALTGFFSSAEEGDTPGKRNPPEP